MLGFFGVTLCWSLLNPIGSLVLCAFVKGQTKLSRDEGPLVQFGKVWQAQVVASCWFLSVCAFWVMSFQIFFQLRREGPIEELPSISAILKIAQGEPWTAPCLLGLTGLAPHESHKDNLALSPVVPFYPFLGEGSHT